MAHSTSIQAANSKMSDSEIILIFSMIYPPGYSTYQSNGQNTSLIKICNLVKNSLPFL